MADCVASTYGGLKPDLQHKPHFGAVQRKFCCGVRNKFRLPARKTAALSVPKLKPTTVFMNKRTMLKCNCLGSLANSEGASISSWIPVVDQVLLTASIFLTYITGVIPIKDMSYRKDLSAQKSISESSISSGSSTRKEEQAYPEIAIDVVKRKLLESLDAFECGVNVGNTILGYDDRHPKRPLHLSALADGPRLRLLWITFQKIEEEVNNISTSESPGLRDKLTVLSSVIQRTCEPVCMAWLESEHGLNNRTIDLALVSLLRSKLIGDSLVLLNMKKSGKGDLYADLLCFLCFGSIREGGYDKSLFISNGVSILEDFLINLADGMASMYLELISIDSNVSTEMNNLSLEICALSTRALQRLRNEVALNQWLYQNMDSIASMYEDRFDLCILQRKFVEEPTNNRRDSWWKALMSHTKSSMASSSLCYVMISQFSMPVKRTKELSALTGWRYYFSLFLELSDIGMPLVKAVVGKVSDAISFFLVTLIGRSLGLIYTGIRQNLRWK